MIGVKTVGSKYLFAGPGWGRLGPTGAGWPSDVTKASPAGRKRAVNPVRKVAPRESSFMLQHDLSQSLPV